MTPELKYKLKRCGALLAQSPLDDKVKDAVIENLGKITEDQIDQLVRMFERETFELTALEALIKSFDEKQESAWNAVESSQRALADKLVEETLEKAKLAAT